MKPRKYRLRIRLHRKIYDLLEMEALWQDSKIGTLANRILQEELVTDLDTAHTFNTFRGISDQREILIPRLSFNLCLIWDLQNIQIVGDLLKGTISTPVTGNTLAVMLGEYHLNICLPMSAHLRAVGINHHSFFRHIIAGCNQPILSFQLYHTYTAGRNLIDSFQITQLRNMNSILCGSLHNGSIFFYGDCLPVNCKIYHNVSLPPLNIPYPK